jgi:hypothetical protein
MKVLCSLTCAAMVAGCSLLPGPPWGDRVATAAPAAVANQPVVGRGPSSITLQPVSPRGAVIGVPYAYDMPHCGVGSPIDLDGSYWDAAGAQPDGVSFDGQPGTFVLTAPDLATFTRSDGQALKLVRHPGAKEFLLCS